MVKKTKKNAVVYGTEENFYESEVIGTFSTQEEAMQCVRDNIRDDLKNAGYEDNELDELVEDCVGDDGGDTCDYCDYRYVYYVETDAEERMEELRNEQLHEHFPEEFEDED